MGYDLTFKMEGPKSNCGFNNSIMSLLREAMRETGAAHEEGYSQALQTPGFAPTSESVDLKKFLSNDSWHVSAKEAGFIAARLTRGLKEGVVSELFMFFDDAPDEAMDWVREFADFNQRAVEYEGYIVR